MRSVVVLPEPDGPSSAKNSPGSISKVDAVQRGELAVPLDDTFEAYLTSTGSSAPSALDGADRQALDDVPLRDDAEHDHRQHRQHRDRRELRPLRLLDRDEVEHRDRHRPHRLPPSTTANRNSFQALRNTKTMVTAMPPRTCGRMTCHSVRSRLARSSSAASSISNGMSSK